MADAAIGERCVRRGHFKRGDTDPQPADRLGRHRFERRGDTHLMGRVGDVFRADIEVELGEDGVDGVPGGAGERHRPPARLGVVDGPGAASRDLQGLRRGAVVVGRVGVDALLDRGRQDKGLEGGAGLPVGLPGVVELAFLAYPGVEASATISPL